MAVALSFGATSSGTTLASTITFNNLAIGAAADDRVVLACVTSEVNATFSSCTIGGNSAALVGQVANTTATPDVIAAIFAAKVTTGTTANVQVTLNTGNGVIGITTIRMVGGSTVLFDADTATGAASTISITGLSVPTFGGGVCIWGNSAQGGGVTWTNVTEVSDINASSHRHSAAITTTAGTVTRTADGSTNEQAILGVSFQESALITAGLFSEADTFYAATAVRQPRILGTGLYSEADTFYQATQFTVVYPMPVFVFDPDDIFFTTVINLGEVIHSHGAVYWFSIEMPQGAARLLKPALHTDPEIIYAPTAQSVNTLAPARYNDADTIYASTLIKIKRLFPTLYSEPDLFAAPTVLGNRTLTAVRVNDADIIYASSVNRSLRPARYNDADAFYAPTLTRGARTLSPTLVAQADIFYAATLLNQGTVAPVFLSDPENFFAPSVAIEAFNIRPALFSDPDVIYAASIRPQRVGTAIRSPGRASRGAIAGTSRAAPSISRTAPSTSRSTPSVSRRRAA